MEVPAHDQMAVLDLDMGPGSTYNDSHYGREQKSRSRGESSELPWGLVSKDLKTSTCYNSYIRENHPIVPGKAQIPHTLAVGDIASNRTR
jgi:hypothetical protein